MDSSRRRRQGSVSAAASASTDSQSLGKRKRDKQPSKQTKKQRKKNHENQNTEEVKEVITKQQIEKLLEDPKPLCCPITFMLYNDPVIIEDGFTYERSFIEKHFISNKLSPTTGVQINNTTTIIPNNAKRSEVNTFKHETAKECIAIAKKLQQQNDIPNAKKLLHRAKELTKENEDIYHMLLSVSEPAEKTKVMEELIELLKSKKKFKEAIKFLSKGIDVEDDDVTEESVESWANLWDLAVSSEDTDLILKLAKKLTDYHLATLDEEARDDVTDILSQLDPAAINDASYCEDIARGYEKLEDLEREFVFLERSAVLYHASEDYPKAEQLAKKALSLKPNSESMTMLYSEVLLTQGKLKESITQLMRNQLQQNAIIQHQRKALGNMYQRVLKDSYLPQLNNIMCYSEFNSVRSALLENRAVLCWNNGNTGLPEICEILKCNSTIQHVHFCHSHCCGRDIDDQGAKEIAGALQDNISIQDVTISSTAIRDDGATALFNMLANNKFLKEFTLTKADVRDKSIEVLSKALAMNNTLKSLSLHNMNMDTKCIKLLCSGLLKNTSIKKLHLSHNNLQLEGCRALAEVIKKSKTLQVFNVAGSDSFGDCKLDIEGAELLFEAISHNANLKSVCIQGSELKISSIELKPALEHLEIISATVNEEFVDAIYTLMKKNSTLKTLKLQSTPLTVEHMRKLSEGLKVNTGLRELCFSKYESACGMYITPQAAEYLANALKHNTTLKVLSLEDNQVSDEGAMSLIRALEVNKTLQQLNLENNSIGDESVKKFCELMSTKNKTLKTLFLMRNKNVTAHGERIIEDTNQSLSKHRTIEFERESEESDRSLLARGDDDGEVDEEDWSSDDD